MKSFLQINILKKLLTIVFILMLSYALVIIFIIVPKVNENLYNSEVKNAKTILKKVITICKNVHLDLQSYQKNSLQKYKEELKTVTDTLWTTILNNDYSKQQIIDAVKKVRYGEDGYFWINDFYPNMIMHPHQPILDGKSLKTYQDPNGVYLFNEFVKTCQNDKEGFVRYDWPKPNEKKPSTKNLFCKNL